MVLSILVFKHELVDKTMSTIMECARSKCHHFTKVVGSRSLETNTNLTSCLAERAEE